MAPDLSCYTNNPDSIIECAFGQLQAPIGEGLFALLIAGGALFALWWAGDGDLAPPSVTLVLFSGVAVGVLPGQFQSIATAIMLIGLAGAILGIAQRYFLEGVQP